MEFSDINKSDCNCGNNDIDLDFIDKYDDNDLSKISLDGFLDPVLYDTLVAAQVLDKQGRFADADKLFSITAGALKPAKMVKKAQTGSILCNINFDQCNSMTDPAQRCRCLVNQYNAGIQCLNKLMASYKKLKTDIFNWLKTATCSPANCKIAKALQKKLMDLWKDVTTVADVLFGQCSFIKNLCPNSGIDCENYILKGAAGAFDFGTFEKDFNTLARYLSNWMKRCKCIENIVPGG